MKTVPSGVVTEVNYGTRRLVVELDKGSPAPDVGQRLYGGRADGNGGSPWWRETIGVEDCAIDHDGKETIVGLTVAVLPEYAESVIDEIRKSGRVTVYWRRSKHALAAAFASVAARITMAESHAVSAEPQADGHP